MNTGNKERTISLQTSLNRTLIERILKSKDAFFIENIGRIFMSFAFENDYTLDKRRLAELPPEELSHFLGFVQKNDDVSIYELGRKRAEEGLNIGAILAMSAWVTQFFLENAEIAEQHLTSVSAKLVSDYFTPYLKGYTNEKSNKTQKQQKEIRAALSTALMGQQNALFIRNYSLDSSINAILLSDSDGQVTYVNASFLKMWGYDDIDEVLGIRRIDRLVGIEIEKIFQSLSSSRTWRGEFRLKRRDGTEFEAEMAASLIVDEQGTEFGIMASFVDITERKRMASQLNRSRKMEALGQLAAGITHDFNNMFSIIQGYLQLIIRDADKDSQLFNDIREIKIAIDRNCGLTKQLQFFARGVDGEKALVDMNAIIDECHTLLSHAFPPSIGFRLDLEELLWPVEADPSQMSHMIINLCVNARDAILVGNVREDGDGFPLEQGGTITIVTRNHVLDAASATIHVKAVPGPYVHITVSDTGSGMTREVLDRLFEPFYSTKKMKKNSGLGLSIIYGIVDKLDGFIDVESRLGEGSAFHIYLPRSEVSHAEEDISEEASTSILQESTILIADDEQALLNIAERYLTAHGFEVLTARNGREAVSRFEKEKARIGVVVLDMIMPEMDGETCLKEIRKMDADIDVILMTGFTADKSLIERMKEQSDVLIEKPFDLDRLCKLLKSMTQKRRSP